MKVLIDIIVFLLVVGLAWIVALEVRFRSLKNITSESKQLATDAVDEAEALLEKVKSHLATKKAAKPKGKR